MRKSVTFTAMSLVLIDDGSEESMDVIHGALACAEESVQRVEMYCHGERSKDDLQHMDRVLQSAVNAVIERYNAIEANAQDESVPHASSRPPHGPSSSRTRNNITFTGMSVALLGDRCDENMDAVLGVLACAAENAYWNRLNREGKDLNNGMVEAQLALGVAVDALIDRYRAIH